MGRIPFPGGKGQERKGSLKGRFWHLVLKSGVRGGNEGTPSSRRGKEGAASWVHVNE